MVFQGLVLENCKIIGTLIDCEMIDTDLCFEKSKVNATIVNEVESIKNPLDGIIEVPAVKEIIQDDPQAKGKILIRY